VDAFAQHDLDPVEALARGRRHPASAPSAVTRTWIFLVVHLRSLLLWAVLEEMQENQRKRSSCADTPARRRPEPRRVERRIVAGIEAEPPAGDREALADEIGEFALAAHARVEARLVVAPAADLPDDAHHVRGASG
jgi:hypothetical protein